MRTMNIMKTSIFVLGSSLVACQNTPVPVSQSAPSYSALPYIELGQEIVETHCSTCHNATRFGASQRADAPPLRTVLKTYNPEALADDFREHIHVGHPDMPDFDFSVKETEGLLTYLRSIQSTDE